VPVPQSFDLIPANDNVVEWGPVVDEANDEAPITDCTGTLTVTDKAGNPITGANALTLTHIGAGIYRAGISGAVFNPPLGENIYRTVIQLSSAGLGAVGKWTIRTSVRAA
jgi:hypothetical protein